MYHYKTKCSLCAEASLIDIIQFPEIPIADALLNAEEISLPEAKVPLTFCVCVKCFHAQIREELEPEILFGRDYPYYTGVSSILSQHFVSSAKNLLDKF